MSTPYARKLLPLCEELGQTALQIAGQVNIKITEHGFLEPKLLALALLSRTLGNFRGTVRLIEQGLLVEARILARCCFENQLVVGGLFTKGIEFAHQIKADDVAGKKARLKFVADNEGIFQALSQETRDEMARAQESLTASKGSYLKFKEASAAGPFSSIYLAYSQLSGDAAHPTFSALMRHCVIEGGNLTFDVVPAENEHQLDETLHLACISLISVAVIVNEMSGYTEAGKSLPELNRKFVTLQTERFGSKEIEPGVEIKTKAP
jgi:hypothetical protein